MAKFSLESLLRDRDRDRCWCEEEPELLLLRATSASFFSSWIGAPSFLPELLLLPLLPDRRWEDEDFELLPLLPVATSLTFS